MSTMVQEVAKAAELPDSVRDAVRDLILVLADSKRLLGMRYGNWMLGAPEIEAGIACASMAQDEWGHARLLYALLREFGDDVDQLEHGRSPAEYRSIEVLDAEPTSWPEFVAINAFVDTALTLQLEALAQSSYLPLRQRVQKLIEEETFHAAHGTAWVRRLTTTGIDARAAMSSAVRSAAPAILQWFGPDSDRARTLREAGIVDATGSEMRTRFIERTSELAGRSDCVMVRVTVDFTAFDESTRRTTGSTPDERTIMQIRGDRNREFLMD